jgi:outer membrane protein
MRYCVRTIGALTLGLVLGLVFGLVFGASAEAQSVRIGYVDMKVVLDNAPQVLAGRARLDREFRARNDAIEMDEVRATALEARLQQGDMSADNRLQVERDVRELRRNITRRKEDLRDELSFRRTEEVQRLEEQINVAVQEIAQRNGFDLILSSPVVYAGPELDITDLILEQLEVEYAADQLELETP